MITFDCAPAGVVVDLAERSAAGDGHDTIFPRGGLRLVGTPTDDVLSGSDFVEEIDGMAGPTGSWGGAATTTSTAMPRERGGRPRASTTTRSPVATARTWSSGTLGSDTLRWRARASTSWRPTAWAPTRIFGGDGDDFLYLTLGIGDHVKLLGGPGRDDVTIDVHPTVPGPGKVLVNLGIEQLALDNVFIGRISSTERLHVGAGVPLSFYGSPGPDEVYADGDGRLRAWTYGGNDVIWGSDLADRIDGGTGSDEVRAGRGRDTCLHVEQRTGCELP